MKIKRLICLFTLCCVLLLPFSAAADGAYNQALRLSMGGDVDADGAITSTDARLILQYAAEKATQNDLHTALADMDSDGAITSTDARLILQFAADKESILPRPQSLPFKTLDTPPQGNTISFKAGETVRESNGLYGYSSKHHFHIVQTTAEWAYLRTVHGFTTNYGETFFAQNALLLCNIWMPYQETKLEIKQVSSNGDTLDLFLRTYYTTDHVLPAPYHALAVVEIPRSALDNVSALAVYFQRDPILPYM